LLQFVAAGQIRQFFVPCPLICQVLCYFLKEPQLPWLLIFIHNTYMLGETRATFHSASDWATKRGTSPVSNPDGRFINLGRELVHYAKWNCTCLISKKRSPASEAGRAQLPAADRFGEWELEYSEWNPVGSFHAGGINNVLVPVRPWATAKGVGATYIFLP